MRVRRMRYNLSMAQLTTNEAADRLGVVASRVRAMIQAGRLPAKKYGRDWLIEEEDLKLVEDRKPGRPPKNPPGKGDR